MPHELEVLRCAARWLPACLAAAQPYPSRDTGPGSGVDLVQSIQASGMRTCCSRKQFIGEAPHMQAPWLMHVLTAAC
jgi:hypothetical protein